MKIIDVNKIDIFEVQDPKLQTILICLFTDAYISPEELPEYIKENRGWWGDSIKTAVNGRKEEIIWGSGLWVFNRQKLKDDTLVEFRENIKKSLKIAVDTGVISEPEVTVSRFEDQLSFVLTFADDEPLQFEGF